MIRSPSLLFEDGFDAVADCKDASAAMHPGAAEVCTDGNNCDLTVDDGDAERGNGS